MEILNITPTEKTPEVKFDIEGTLYIGGRSVHEHPDNFYNEIIDIVDKTKEGKKLQVVLDFEYFNTGAAKMILKLLQKISERKKSEVIWKYEFGDDDMQEAGEDYASMINNVSFNLVEKPE